MIAKPVQSLFAWKIRGVRWIEIIGLTLVAAMVFSVYVAKAAAGRESARIGQLEREIAEHRQRVRLLRAEAARLEQPARLEILSRGAGLAPTDVARRADGKDLAGLTPVAEPAPAPAPAPAAVEAAPVPGAGTAVVPEAER